jgi:hypothetical protein
MPVVVVTAEATGFGRLATTSSDLRAGASLAPPRVRWAGPTVFEGAGIFGGRIEVVPAAVPDGAPVPDGVVCIEFAAPTSSSGDAVLVAPEGRSCHPAGEPFEVDASVTVPGDRNTSVQMSLPYTVVHRPVGATEDLVVATGGTELPSFDLTKPADPLESTLIALAIVGLSTAVPLLLLLFLINRQRRLPRPATRRVAHALLLDDGGEVRRADGWCFTSADLVPVQGTRSEYHLPAGISVVSPRTFNPFAPTVVEARCDRGSISAVPWTAPGSGRSVQVPAGFRELVVIRSVPGSAEVEAVVIVPADASAADADRALERALACTNGLWSRVSAAMGLVEV